MAPPAPRGRHDGPEAKKPVSQSSRLSSVLVIVALTVLFSQRHALSAFLSSSLVWQVVPNAPASITLSLAIASLIWLTISITHAVITGSSIIPGPRLAKATVAWKTFHLATGTYKHRLRDLHQKYGGLVQIAPSEYSVNDPSRIWKNKLIEVSSPFSFMRNFLSPQSLAVLADRLNMANIYSYEAGIQKCNDALLQTLIDCAHTGGTVNLTDAISRYAYDLVFVATAGEPADFQSQNIDVHAIKRAMQRWKLTAILCGSYFRFRPFITRLIHKLQPRNLETITAEHLKSAAHGHMEGTSDAEQRNMIEASIALMIAGTDPAITHILSSLFYAYRDDSLLQQLRDEIKAAKLSDPPEIQELLLAAPRMPYLHAILQEALRLHLPTSGGYKYEVPQGGEYIHYQYVPDGCKICIEPSVAHLNPAIFGADPDSFQLHLWLARANTRLNSHMLGFGAEHHSCPGQNLHFSVITKLLTQVIPNVNIRFKMPAVVSSAVKLVEMTYNDIKACVEANVSLPVGVMVTTMPNGTPQGANTDAGKTTNGAMASGAPHITINAKAPISPATSSSGAPAVLISWIDERFMEETIGRDATNALIKRFDPSKPLIGGKPFQTPPIPNAYERATMHRIIEHVWNNRLGHETKGIDQTMWLWVLGTHAPFWLQKLHNTRKARSERAKKHVANAATPVSKTNNATRTEAPRPVNATWTNFADTAKTTSAQLMSMQHYLATKAEEAKMPPPLPNNVTFKEKTIIREIPKVEETETAKAIIPPHIRARNAAVAAKQAEAANSIMDTTWVAAKLPNPCFN